MVVEELEDGAAFLDAVERFLLRYEARNNLVLGIAGNLRDNPGVYDDHRSWVVRDGREVLCAALRTPPYNLVLAGPTTVPALEALAEWLHARSAELPGVTGAVPEAADFARLWSARAGVEARPRMSQHIYRLETLRPPEGVPGRARQGTSTDRALLVEWVDAFAREAVGDHGPTHAPERIVDARLERGTGGFSIWEDGVPVSLAGWGGTTPNGVRIGPVYTPPEHRRRGYGGAVTAAVTAERLAAGRRFCFLYTDAANPTSNDIYARIGYERVCDSVDLAFDPAP